MKQALLVIDVQNDFCEGGVLPAKNTVSLIEPLNRCIKWASSNNIFCVFTRDWHPADHCSFKPHGGVWLPHCVQGTKGAEFTEGLFLPDSFVVVDIEKYSDLRNSGYSAFENTKLNKLLQERGITDILITGIATDYCVRATAIDAVQNGYTTIVLTDLIRPIDLLEIDSAVAMEEMADEGIILWESSRLLQI
jgi:Amidases related to nicotinamidase